MIQITIITLIVCLLFAGRFFRSPKRFLSVLYAALLTALLTACFCPASTVAVPFTPPIKQALAP